MLRTIFQICSPSRVPVRSCALLNDIWRCHRASSRTLGSYRYLSRRLRTSSPGCRNGRRRSHISVRSCRPQGARSRQAGEWWTSDWSRNGNVIRRRHGGGQGGRRGGIRYRYESSEDASSGWTSANIACGDCQGRKRDYRGHRSKPQQSRRQAQESDICQWDGYFWTFSNCSTQVFDSGAAQDPTCRRGKGAATSTSAHSWGFDPGRSAVAVSG